MELLSASIFAKAEAKNKAIVAVADVASVIVSYILVVAVQNINYLFEIKYIAILMLFILIVIGYKAIFSTHKTSDVGLYSSISESFTVLVVFIFAAGALAFLVKEAYYSRFIIFALPFLFFVISSIIKILLIKYIMSTMFSGEVLRVLFIAPREKIQMMIDETPRYLRGLKIELLFLTPAPEEEYPGVHILNSTSREPLELSQILVENNISEIFADFEYCVKDNFTAIIEAAEIAGIRIHMFIDSPELQRYGLRIDKFPGVVIMTTPNLPLDNPLNMLIKRTFDIIFSAIILFAFSWLFLLVAILVKISSPGPVFFKPQRVGDNNEIFTCYKFRSMIVTPPEISKTMSTAKNDPRITTIGKYLRKMSLDELPQFWNVLLGEMSVVGPRPHRVNLDKELWDSYEKYKLRHFYKPGVSGWSQVNGLRGSMETDESRKARVEYDLWYLENWNFFLDIKIIFMTLFGKYAWQDIT